MNNILYVDDRSKLSTGIRVYLGTDPGTRIERVFSTRVALEKIARNPYQGVVCTSGIEGAGIIRSRADELAVPFLMIRIPVRYIPLRSTNTVTIEGDHCSLEFCMQPGSDVGSQVPEIGRYILQHLQAGNRPAGTDRDSGVLHEVLQQMQIPFGLLVNNVLLWANDDCAAVLGYTERELRGKPVRDLFADNKEYVRFWHDAGGRRDASGWGQAEVSLVGKDRAQVPCRVRIHRISPINPAKGHIVLFEDLRAEEARAETVAGQDHARALSEIEYQESFESTRSAIIRADPDGDICFFNGMAGEVFGYTPDEVLGKNIVGTIVPSGSRYAREMLTLLSDITSGSGEPRLHAFENQKKDGQLFWVAWNTLPLRDREGRIAEVLLIGQDITGHDPEGKRVIRTSPWKYRALEGTDVKEEVFDQVFHICIEISREGRESRKIGTSFVIGDAAGVMSHSRQCAINAFGGVPEDQRMVQQQENRENIKNFAQLDGAFVIRGDGLIVASSRHFTAGAGEITLPMGYGTRHASVAGITRKTHAVGIVVSESGGTITVFRRGAIVKQVVA